MKTIVVISTGGTIASIKNDKTGLLSAGVLSGEELISLCNINFKFKIETESIFQIPSNQMSFEKLIILKEKVQKIFERDDVNGIVITHGTDTLEETAYFLDLTVSDNRPIVVTGAQLGPMELGTDAIANLRQAIIVSANSSSCNLGTLVTFNGRIFTARHVTKSHSSSVDGFSSHRYGYIGIIDLDKVYFYFKPTRSKTFEIANKLPKVEIVKYSLGSENDYIRYLVEKDYAGLILEGYGRGHVNPTSIDNIKFAVKEGVTVIITTTCRDGEVAKKYDFAGSIWELENIGVILGKDYDSKKARIKLAVVLSTGIINVENEFKI